jgi:hypothetical protein
MAERGRQHSKVQLYSKDAGGMHATAGGTHSASSFTFAFGNSCKSNRTW